MTISRRSVMMAAVSTVVAATPRYALSAPLTGVVLDAKPFAQTKSMSCWAAAAVMLLRWKNSIPFSESDVAKTAGQKFDEAFKNNTGLNGEDFAEFASALGLTTEAPQNFTPLGYHDLIKAHGPLWIGSRLDVDTPNSRRHIRVLRGVTGDGTFNGSTAWVLDSDGGRDYQSTVAQFAAELEQIAKEEIADGNDLYSQVIRFP